MTVQVAGWHDTQKGDYRALVDATFENGETEAAACRGGTPDALQTWLTAILKDFNDPDVELVDCGDMHGPSLAAVRTKALFLTTKAALDPGQQ